MTSRLANATSGWDRFKNYIGCTWDSVYEAGLGDPVPAESQTILDLGYWGQEITHQTVEGIKSGKRFDEIEKRALVFTIYAPDGMHRKRFRSKKAMAAHVLKYGPVVHRRSAFRWVDDDGYDYELEGMSIEEVFGKPEPKVEPAPCPVDAEPDFEKLWEQHLDSKTDTDPRGL